MSSEHFKRLHMLRTEVRLGAARTREQKWKSDVLGTIAVVPVRNIRGLWNGASSGEKSANSAYFGIC